LPPPPPHADARRLIVNNNSNDDDDEDDDMLKFFDLFTQPALVALHRDIVTGKMRAE